jgi:hypothetical protein
MDFCCWVVSYAHYNLIVFLIGFCILQRYICQCFSQWILQRYICQCFSQWILHDWSDDDCVKLLKNSHKALPEKGKVIVVDTILPMAAETSPYARHAFHLDLLMLAYAPGGKERTEQEFRELGHAAGFTGGVQLICCVDGVS